MCVCVCACVCVLVCVGAVYVVCSVWSTSRYSRQQSPGLSAPLCSRRSGPLRGAGQPGLDGLGLLWPRDAWAGPDAAMTQY